MASATVDVIAPKQLILPKVGTMANTANASVGTIGISGNAIIWTNGTDWFQISGQNTGD